MHNIFSLTKGGKLPKQAHRYDAGWDLFVPTWLTENEHKQLEHSDCYLNAEHLILMPNVTATIPLHVRIDFSMFENQSELMALVLPRSSVSALGVICHTGVIDAGYTGFLHVSLSNPSSTKPVSLPLANAIAQLCFIPAYTAADGHQRGNGALGSSNK